MRFRFTKKWLWLLAIPVGIVGAPFLFIAMMMGTRLLSAFTGPINIWNTTTSIPSDDEIVGHYKLSGRAEQSLHAHGVFISNQSGFTLKSNHKLEVVDLPAFDVWGSPRDCNYNGIGTWGLYGASGGITLNMNIQATLAVKGNLKACAIENAGLMTLLGHSSPHRFWYVIGDPNEDTGLLYTRE